MANKYFTLTNSNMTLSRKFRVLHSSFDPIKEKSQTVRKTLNGQYDISVGGIFERHEYVIRVHATDPEAADGFGNKAELDTFFSYNNPNPVSGPSDKLFFEDHFGVDWLVKVAGDFAPKLLGVSTTGVNAVYHVKVVFLMLQLIGPS